MWMVPLMFSFISMGFWSVIPTPPNRSRGRPWTSVHRLSKLFSWFNYVTNKPLHKTRIYDLKPRIRVNQFCNNKRKYIQYISFCCYKRSSMFYQNRLENKYKNLLRSETSMASLIKFLSKTILCFFNSKLAILTCIWRLLIERRKRGLSEQLFMDRKGK